MLRSRRRRGFTLIELLTVLVIIGLLAAILLPSFARARFSAQLTSCQSNLKNIGTAVRMYANDNDQRFPLQLNRLRVNPAGKVYLGAIAQCPSNGSYYVVGYQVDSVTNQAFTVYCPGIHYQLMTGVSQGYPQFQTNDLVTQ